ncbi:hypothetical protein [Virgibacillus pantothenticus]|uniref:hypothetical protein n=1 Tax=Virgibacillus pantothenticus TaxID=1473 RepID=UPI0014799B2E|nr:hypothetical protein [Virgibacillus pantothenticus]
MFDVRIMGTGKAVGSKVVSNEELEREMQLKKGWIFKSTGIKSRYYIDEEKKENALTLGVDAAKKAISDSQLELTDIDCIIGANGSPMQGVPCAASIFQREIGLEKSGIPCFDIDSTCFSFPVALFIGANLIHNNVYRNILIISSDAPSFAIKIADKKSDQYLAMEQQQL